MPDKPTKTAQSKKTFCVKRGINQKKLKQIYLPKETDTSQKFTFADKENINLKINEGVLCFINKNGHTSQKPNFAALYLGKNTFKPICSTFNDCLLQPKAEKENQSNWGQHVALAQLLNRKIVMVTLTGPAGTGKTLLTIAAAISLKKHFKQIIITNPEVPMGGKKRNKEVPGTIQEKLKPWVRPIHQAVSLLSELNNKNFKKQLLETDKPKIEALSLDHFLGLSFMNTFVIVDEAQNLRSKEIKNIITRMGEKSKLVFSGDTDQISISEEDSGLLSATQKMLNHPLVAATHLNQIIRSPLAKRAIEVL